MSKLNSEMVSRRKALSLLGLATLGRNRSKTGGGGMILRFPVPRESDSFWEWYRLPILTAFPTPS